MAVEKVRTAPPAVCTVNDEPSTAIDATVPVVVTAPT